MHPSDPDLPDFETARRIVAMSSLINRTNSQDDLVRIAEMTLTDEDDFAGEQHLGDAW